jgi:hypothetical protein
LLGHLNGEEKEKEYVFAGGFKFTKRFGGKSSLEGTACETKA